MKLLPADIVHVEDGRVGIQTGRVELVAVLHGDAPERLEVFGKVCLLQLRQTGLHNLDVGDSLPFEKWGRRVPSKRRTRNDGSAGQIVKLRG